MADAFTYKDLYKSPKIKDASAEGHLKSVNTVASNYDNFAWDNTRGNSDYNAGAEQRQAIYTKERDKAIRIQSQKSLDKIQGSEAQQRIVNALKANDGDTASLQPLELQAFNEIQGIPSLAPNLSSKKFSTTNITASGVGSDEGKSLGRVNIYKRLNGEIEGNVIIDGIKGVGKTVRLTPNVDESIKTSELELKATRESKVKAEESLQRTSNKKFSTVSFGVGAGGGASGKPMAMTIAKNKVKKIENDIKNQESRLESIKGKGGASFLINEELEKILKSDEYAGQIGEGWNLKTISEEVGTSIPKLIGGMVQGGVILSTALFDKEGKDGEPSLAEKGRGVATAIQDEFLDPLNQLGSSRARFRNRTRDIVAMGLLEEAPQLIGSMGTSTIITKTLKKTADVMFDAAKKKALKKGLSKAGGLQGGAEGRRAIKVGIEGVSKARQKVIGVSDKFLTPFIASAPDSLQVASGQFQTAMAAMDKQIDGFDSVEKMQETAGLLQNSENEEMKKNGDALMKRVDEFNRIEDNLFLNTAGTMIENQLLEFVPMFQTFKRGRISAEDMFQRQKNKLRVAGKFEQVVTSGLSGAGERAGAEILQTAAANLNTKALANPEQKVGEGVLESGIVAALLGSTTNVAATGISIAGRAEALNRLQQTAKNEEEVQKIIKDIVIKDDKTGKFIFTDRDDSTEEFDTEEEAAVFAKNRHGIRLFNQFTQFQLNNGSSEEDINTSLDVISMIIDSTAAAKNVKSDDIYERISFKDLSAIAEPDLQGQQIAEKIASEIPAPTDSEGSQLTPVINPETGNLEVETVPVNQIDSEPLSDEEIKSDRSSEIQSMLGEVNFKLGLEGNTPADVRDLKGRKLKLEKALTEIENVNAILNSGKVTKGEESKLLSRRSKAQQSILKLDDRLNPPGEIDQSTRISQIDGLLATDALSADERATLESEKGDLTDELEILSPEEQQTENDELVGEETPEERKFRERGQQQRAEQVFDDPKAQKRREDAGRRILEKEKNKEKRDRRKRTDKFDNRLFQGDNKKPLIPPRGSIETIADQNKVLIKAYQNADASTLIHEMLHAIDLLTDEDGVSLLDAVIGEDKTAEDFWKWATDGGRNERSSVATREKLAGGLEVFLSNGKAPSDSLKPLFSQISGILKNIYKGLKTLPSVRLNKAAEKGFDKLFVDNVTDTINSTTERVDVGAVSIFTDAEKLFQGNIPESEIPDKGSKPVNMTTPIVTNSDGSTEGSTVTDPTTLLDGTGKRFDAKMEKLRKKHLVSERKGLFRFAANSFDALTRGALEPTQDSLPQTVFAAKNKKEGMVNRIASEARQMNRLYNKVMDEATGGRGLKGLNRIEKKSRAIIGRKVNDYLKEKQKDVKNQMLNDLPPSMRPVVQQMRAAVDNLSKALIRSGSIKGKMIQIFDDGLGSYLHRSYQIRTRGASWEDQISNDEDKEIINAAKESFKRIFGAKTDEEQENVLNAFLNPANFGDGPVSFFKSGRGLTVQQKNILKHRNDDIPPEWRALWGEENDPMKNFTNTIIKQATLLASHNMIRDIKDAGIEEGWIAHKSDLRRNSAIDTRINSKSAKSLDPLADYMTTREIAGALQRAFDTTNETNAWVQALFKANQVAKLTKTAASLGTHQRNFLGGGIMYFGNGNYDITNVLKGAGVGSVQGFGRGSYTSQQLFNELVELGVVEQNLVSAEFDAVFNTALTSKSTEEYADKFSVRIGRAAKGTTKKLLDIYQAGDTVWKAADYLSNLDMLIKAHQGKIPLSELKRMAAARTRATMPTYGLAPKPIQALSKSPFIGTFVLFQAESIRITVNQFKLAVQDARSENDVIRNAGYRRMGGLIASRFAFPALSMASMSWNDISSEEDEALRSLLPEWDKLGDLIYVGRNKKTGEPIFMNSQFLNPYNFVSETGRAAFNVTPQNALSPSLSEGLLGVGSQVASPFLGQEIGFKNLVDLIGGSSKASKSDNFVGDMFAVAKQVATDVALPSTFPQLQKLSESFKGNTPLGAKETSLAFLVGLTPKQADFNSNIKFGSRRIKAKLNEVGDSFAKDISDGVDPVEAISMANAERELIYEKGTEMSDAGLTWMMSPEKIEDLMISGGLSKTDISAIMGGETSTITLTERQAIAIERKRPGTLLKVAGIVDIRRGKKRIPISMIEAKVR